MRPRPPSWCAARAGLLLVSAGLFAPAGCKSQEPKQAGQPLSTTVLDVFEVPTPAEAAAWSVDPYDSDKRQRGLLLLANAPFGGEPPYLKLYEMAIDDEDPNVRVVAVRALALHGDPSNVPAIANRLDDTSIAVRREAARALQRLHNDVAIEPLMRAVDPKKESDPDTRAYAAQALGQYAEPRVVGVLIGALDDRRLSVNQGARESLRTLTGQDFGFITRQWVEWTKEQKNLFASRQEYIYPVFHRDPTIVELILPFWSPPNEVAAAPVGMPRMTPEAEGDKAAEPTASEPAEPPSGGS